MRKRDFVRAAALLSALSAAPSAGGAQDRSTMVRNTAHVSYEHVRFDDALDPWHLASLGLALRRPAGTWIGRINYAHRFADPGVQLEAEAFPRLGSRGYAEVGAAWSPSGTFPGWRLALEPYLALPSGWEVSIGARLLDFDAETVEILTGSLTNYIGNWWFSARPFVAVVHGRAEVATLLSGRHYAGDGEQFVGATIGYGSSPGEGVTLVELERRSTILGRVHGKHAVHESLRVTWGAGFQREEPAPGRRRHRGSIELGVERDI